MIQSTFRFRGKTLSDHYYVTFINNYTRSLRKMALYLFCKCSNIFQNISDSDKWVYIVISLSNLLYYK